MPNWPPNFDDSIGSSGSPVTLGTAYAAGTTSPAISTEGHKYVGFFIYVVTKSSATRIDAQIQVSDTGGASDAVWASLQTEDVTAGVATLSDYELQKAGVDTMATVPALFLPITMPVRANRFFRIKLKADAGTPTVYARFSLSGGPI